MTRDSLDRSYFETMYERDADPWSFATSAYEAEKYARSLAALRPSYDRALELGCSIGVFTHDLAPRCTSLLAVDISERALTAARRRNADRPTASFARIAVPAAFPPGRFDLITCCEVGYYWSDADLAAARERIAGALAPGGDLLLVHWLPLVTDYPQTGDHVHDEFLADDRYSVRESDRTDRYRLDVLVRR